MLPIIIGSIPNTGGMSLGDHSLPKMKQTVRFLSLPGLPPGKQKYAD